MRTFDLSPLFRSSVGFEQLDKLFESAFREATRDVSYPPYNIIKAGDNAYRIEMAVAGFAEDDLDVSVNENLLTVSGQVKDAENGREYLHRGIAKRAFEHKFRLADYVRVNDARLVNGLLEVELVRELPDAMRPRKIAIGKGGQPKVIEGGRAEAAA